MQSIMLTLYLVYLICHIEYTKGHQMSMQNEPSKKLQETEDDQIIKYNGCLHVHIKHTSSHGTNKALKAITSMTVQR